MNMPTDIAVCMCMGNTMRACTLKVMGAADEFSTGFGWGKGINLVGAVTLGPSV